MASATKDPGADLPKSLWRAYLETALWTSHHSAGEDNEYPDPRGVEDGESYDSEYGNGDFDEKSLNKLAGYVRKFLETPGVEEAISEADVKYGQDDEHVGHDLWLTQGGHGSGFWDGDYGDDDDVTTPAYILTEAAKKLPQDVNLTSYQPDGTEDPEDALIVVE
jgi:hypothetical protein